MIEAGDIVTDPDGRKFTIVEISSDKFLIRSTFGNVIKELPIQDLKNYMNRTNVYNIMIQSPFILTPTQVKNKLGIGFKVLTIETERDIPDTTITDVDSAVAAIIQTGYRALARANHPDLGGDSEVMLILNRSKKELLDLLESVK